MFKFDNTHIFTGYLKQKLSSVNIPTCRVYTQENADYFATHGIEDPRIVESINNIFYNEEEQLPAKRVNYLKDDSVYNFYSNQTFCNENERVITEWSVANTLYYTPEKTTPGLTKKLNSPGRFYDKVTHEYLGDYLRFLRDYYNVNLMSLYNCFNNAICSNLNISYSNDAGKKIAVFNSSDNKYRIYAIPVKLFNTYTIAIDSHQGFEVMCGFYNGRSYTHTLETSNDSKKAETLYAKTYQKVSKSMFSQPVLFKKLAVDNWLYSDDIITKADGTRQINLKSITRWDVLEREQDLKMFLKVPAACKSSITILEGDFSHYNNALYRPNTEKNLSMENCGEGSQVTISGNRSATVKDYFVDHWNRYLFNVEETPSNNSDKITDNVIVSSIEYFDDEAPIWTQGAMTKPSYSETDEACLISTAEELAYVVKNGGKTLVVKQNGQQAEITKYKLTSDIYINNPAAIDWKTGNLATKTIKNEETGEKEEVEVYPDYVIRNWFDTSDVLSPFAGTIDGNNFVIYGLFYAKASESVEEINKKVTTGLLPLINADKHSYIQNLGINYAYLKADTVSSFVGNTTSTGNEDRWFYDHNYSVVNFSNTDKLDNKAVGFKPISKLQLLAFNTGESHPFADRLIEYLAGSAITPLDEISDNIKRAQHVIKQNNYYFKHDGIWENKIQKIIYDSIINSGPMEYQNGKIIDKNLGYHLSLGKKSKSTLYDVLGYVDKDAEKWYASWKVETTEDPKNPAQKVHKVKVKDTIQNANIYGKLYDI